MSLKKALTKKIYYFKEKYKKEPINHLAKITLNQAIMKL